MNLENQSLVTYFTLKGISEVPELQVPIFLLVLLIYLLTLVSNMTILLLICVDHHLHNPMYFFLGNLAILDMSSSTVTLHKVLTSFLLDDKSISHSGCMTQIFLFASLIGVELLILMVMSYDRYVAICKPLYYHMVMNWRVCSLLATVCWIWGFMEFLPHIIILAGFTCYLSRGINHFFCDAGPLVKLTCNNTHLLDLLSFITDMFLASCPLLLTIIPYIFIISVILKIKSSTSRSKAFYTCSSHLTVIVLLYGTLICQYVRPVLKEGLESNKLFSLFNTAVVPMLNPIIYSLKNKDVKSALRRMRCNVDM